MHLKNSTSFFIIPDSQHALKILLLDWMLQENLASDGQPRDRVSGNFEEPKDGTWKWRQRKGRSEEEDS